METTLRGAGGWISVRALAPMRAPRSHRVPLLVLALAGPGCADGDATPNLAGADEPSSPYFDPFKRQPPIDRFERLRSGDACAAGEYVAVVDATGERGCAACAAGSYSTGANASACQPWSSCPPGQYVESEPTVSADRVCADCAAGMHSTRDNSPRCVPDDECAPGTQAVDAPGSAEVVCEDCPEGTWNDGTSSEGCRTPSACAPGSWLAEEFESTHDRRCEACVEGTYSSESNASDCSACEPGSYCPSGSAEPVSCVGELWDSDGDPTTPCDDRTLCNGYRELSPGTSLTDRECSPGEWYHELGQHGGESAGHVVVDAVGDVYVLGYTRGDIDGNGPRGGDDLFVRKLSGTEGTEIWRVQWGSAEDEHVRATLLDSNGALVVAGNCFGDLTGEICLRKLSPSDGTLLSTVELGDLGDYIAFSANGDIAVSGELDTHVFARKMSADGETLWETALEESSERGGGVAFDSAGNVAVSYAKSVRGGYFPRRIGYVSSLSGDSGALLWTAELDFDDLNYPNQIRSDDADGLIVSARVSDDTGSASERLALLDSQNGTVVWSRYYSDDQEPSASFEPGGDIFVQDGYRTVQRLARQDGSELWAATLRTWSAKDVVSTPSGDAVILGGGVWTERLHGADGSSQWYDSITTSRADSLGSVAFDAVGDVIVAGRTNTSFEREAPNGAPDALVRKLSGDTGVPLWTRQFGSDTEDDVYALSVDSFGDVVVGGYVGTAFASDSLGDWDAFVSKLSGADGSTLWSTQFGSVYTDMVEAIATDALGDTVVTGYAEAAPQAEESAPKAYARKLSGVDGSLLWETILGDETGAAWSAPAVGVMPNGDAIAAWIMVDYYEHYSGIVRLSGVDGSVVWQVLFDADPRADGAQGIVQALAVDAAGDIALSVMNSYLVKLSGEDGSRLWTSDNGLESVAVDSSGDFIGVTSEDIRRLSGADGRVSAIISAPVDELLKWALAVSATGDIVLAGTSNTSPGSVDTHDDDGFVVKLLR